MQCLGFFEPNGACRIPNMERGRHGPGKSEVRSDLRILWNAFMEPLPLNGWQNISPWHWEASFVGGKPLTIVSWRRGDLNWFHLGDMELPVFATGNVLVVWILRSIYDLYTTKGFMWNYHYFYTSIISYMIYIYIIYTYIYIAHCTLFACSITARSVSVLAKCETAWVLQTPPNWDATWRHTVDGRNPAPPGM